MMKLRYAKAMGLLCGLGILAAMGTGTLTASAYTPEDVAAYAYSINYPNAASYVNQAYAAIQSGKVKPEEISGYCASAMATLQAWDAKRQSNVEDILNQTTTAAGDNSGSQSQTTTTAAASGNTGNTGGNTSSGSSGSNSSGTMSDAEFTKLPLDRKIQYVNTLPQEQRSAFINSLSNDAKNSILKQMGTDRQLEMVSDMLDTSSGMGLNFSLDSVSDDGIVISTRDADGNLVDVTTYGNSVESTGIPYTVPVLTGVGAIVLAAAGLGGALWYSKRKEARE